MCDLERINHFAIKMATKDATETQVAEPLTILPVSSDAQLLDICQIATRCRELLLSLAKPNENSGNPDSEASKQLTSFNIWAANVGVFRAASQSLAARLKSIPDISTSMQKILTNLEVKLELKLAESAENENTSGEETDASSDRSSISFDSTSQLYKDGLGLYISCSKTWMAINSAITTLRQLGVRLHHAGARHRRERIDRFISINGNKDVYKLFDHLAFQMVANLFPKASDTLKERAATSIARRRLKLLYLETHQMKLREIKTVSPTPDVPIPKQNIIKEPHPIRKAPGLQKNYSTSISRVTSPSMYPKTQLSATVDTKWQGVEKAVSVSSIRSVVGQLPTLPTIDNTSMSFTCPYCLLVCPSTEASSANAWQQHLIRDLEPFFCVFDECDMPFACGQSQTAWAHHMKQNHALPMWNCPYCPPLGANSRLSSSMELNNHLENSHADRISQGLRDVAVEHSKVQTNEILGKCPFCNGYPDDIDKEFPNHSSRDAIKSLENHIRHHLDDIALLLLPIDMGDDVQQDGDSDVEAERGNRSEQNVEDLELLIERFTASALRCSRVDCDCHIDPSILSGSWANWEDFCIGNRTLFNEQGPVIGCFDPVYRESAAIGEWEFSYPRSLARKLIRSNAEFPSVEHDTKLRELFNVGSFTKDHTSSLYGPETRMYRMMESLRQLMSTRGPSSDWYKSTIPNPAPNSCNWVDSCDQIIRWKRGEVNHLTIIGSHGCGKSVLSKHIADSTTNPLCYVFLPDDQMIKGSHIMAIVLYQLFSQFPDLLETLSSRNEIVDDSGRITTTRVYNLLEQCGSLSQFPISSIPMVLIILDGISASNCDKTSKMYIHRLMNLRDSRFRFLTTTQDPDDMALKISNVTENLYLAENTSFTETRSRTFEAQLDVLFKQKAWPATVRAEIIRITSTNARDYLYDSLSLEVLKSSAFERIVVNRATSKITFPNEAKDAFNKLARESMCDEGIRFILSCLIIARRPMSKAEIQNILAISGYIPALVQTLRHKGINSEKSAEDHKILDHFFTWLLIDYDGWISFRHTTLISFTIEFLDIASGAVREVDAALGCAQYLDLFNRMSRDEIQKLDLLHLLPFAATLWEEIFSHYPNFMPQEELREPMIAIFDVESAAFRTWFPIHREMYRIGNPPAEPYNSLLIAAYFRASCLVKAYLTDQVAIDSTDGTGRTALSWAASDASVSMVRLLLSKNANINTKSIHGLTPLMYAIDRRRIEIVKELLDYDAYIEATENTGKTPLMYAALVDDIDIIRLLMDRGANINAMDDYRRTPLIYSTMVGHANRVLIAKLLLDHGANDYMEDTNGNTALSIAIELDDAKMVSLLVHTIEDSTQINHRQRALWLAARLNLIDLVAIQLDAGSVADFLNIHERESFNLNRLHGTEPVAILLLQRYVKKYIQEDASRTCLSWDSRVPYNSITKAAEYSRLYAAAVELKDFTSLLERIEKAESVHLLERSTLLAEDVSKILSGPLPAGVEHSSYALQYLSARILCLTQRSTMYNDRLTWLEGVALDTEEMVSDVGAAFLLATQELLLEEYIAKGHYTSAIDLVVSMLECNYLTRDPTSHEHCTLLVILAELYRYNSDNEKAIETLGRVLGNIAHEVTDPEKIEALRLLAKDERPATMKHVVETLDADRLAILHILLGIYCNMEIYPAAWGVMKEMVDIANQRSQIHLRITAEFSGPLP
ncbi:hypothetical protein VHEMI04340 [[Torrubiella] hemipterigena]|uniref:Nephrocystin 3-like N-terminal domain-containing protein n=1 Tax=[Torrubiella] hemipterigena TaxID=1531966 RepID=A0A0A1TDI9_9HYPO|nr:hypothetical protein VHEMI04340 [[Torrubiella] hemipterigena]